MNKEQLIEIIRDLYKKEHAQLGEILSQFPKDTVANNWQRGKVNGIGTVLDLIQNMDF